MKKSALLIAGLLAWGSTSMHADEGMWTLYNLPDAVYEQMVAEGFQLPCDGWTCVHQPSLWLQCDKCPFHR